MLNWVVVGIGDITSRRVIPAILAEPRSRLYGIVTRNPSKAQPFSNSGARVWTDLSQALADSDVDAVYVGTPVFLHAQQTIAALETGKHVLCEKPLGMHYGEACAMLDASRRTGRLFGAAYYRRFYPKVQRAKQLMSEGAIGQPVLAEANCHSEWPDENGPRGWLLDPIKAGGGPLYDIASHRIDLMNYWFGRPVRVAAQLGNAVHAGRVEDNATVLIEYASGARGIVDVRWHSQVFRDQCRIIGTEGELNLTPLSEPDFAHGVVVEQLPAHDNIHYPCIEAFVAGVLDGTPLLASGEAGSWTDWVTGQACAYNETGARP